MFKKKLEVKHEHLISVCIIYVYVISIYRVQ